MMESVAKAGISVAFVYFAAACASTQREAKEIETQNIIVKGNIGDAKIGLNEDDEIIIQEETDADAELQVQDTVNRKLQSDLNHETFMLKMCRRDLADPRLGGDGNVPEIREVDRMKDVAEVKEELGLNEDGELKVVRKSYYVDRLKVERKYERTLSKMLTLIKNHRDECEFKMGLARNKAGLPSERYVAQGYFLDNGTWVETRKAENSLSDAFEIQAMLRTER